MNEENGALAKETNHRPLKKPAKISGANVTSLGSLEAELMGLLWEMGRPVNPMDVAEAALYRRRAQGQEPVAFATVNTTLRRLADKGLLLSEKHETRTPYYTPTVGREEMAARILNNVSVTLLGQTLHGLIPRLAGSQELASTARRMPPNRNACTDCDRLWMT